MNSRPLVSIIIPVHNGGPYLDRCLDALKDSNYPNYEIIAVDDGSTDGTAGIAIQNGVTIHRLPHRSGPAAARNLGARYAKGDVFFFIDSDVQVRRETINLVIEKFRHNPDISAIFGSYDDDPAEKKFISQYKNLFHHFHHQQAKSNASTFWAGCGAIRKEVFEEVGGFDQIRYVRPSTEDIELGYRICKRGRLILLDKDLQVKHLKRWGFWSLLRSDIFQRAIPWSRLILEKKRMPNDLNLQTTQKICTGLSWLLVLMLLFSFFGQSKFHDMPLAPIALPLSLIIFLGLLFLNKKLYVFFAQKRGIKFLIKAVPLHILYYLYSGFSFIFCWFTMCWRPGKYKNRGFYGQSFF